MVVVEQRTTTAGWRRQLSSNPSYRAYFVARTLSVAGSQLTYAATPLVCLTAYHSPVAAGIAGTCGYGGSIAFGLLGTPLADRLPRKSMMVVADGLRCIAMALIALSLMPATRPPVAVLFLSVTFIAAVSGAFNAASAAMLPGLIPASDYAAAAAANQARDFSLALLGPVLGAALVVTHPSLPFWLDGASYLASMLFLLLIKDNAPGKRLAERYVVSLRAGITSLRSDMVGLGLILTSSVLNVLLSLLVYSTLAEAVSQGHAGLAGWILGAQAVGGLVGTALVRRAYSAISPRRLLAGHLSVWVVGALLIVSSNSLPLAATTLACMWLTVPAFRTLVAGHLVQTHPDQFRGRVFGLYDLISSVSAGLGPLAAGVAFTHSATTGVVLGVASLAVVVAVAGVVRPMNETHAILTRR